MITWGSFCMLGEQFHGLTCNWDYQGSNASNAHLFLNTLGASRHYTHYQLPFIALF